jgi:DNA repair exonuclease SbcCD ATPase subunit
VKKIGSFDSKFVEITENINNLNEKISEALNNALDKKEITNSLSSMGEIIENKISILGDKINSIKDNEEKYYVSSSTLENLEGLSEDIKRLKETFGENLTQETQSVKEGFTQLQEKIEEIEPLIQSFFGDGIENKINKIQEIITATGHENYVKIYEIINARIEDFEQSAIEKTNESSSAVKETIEALQNEVRASLVGLIDFKGELLSANKEYAQNLEEPIQKILENLDNLTAGNELRELSDTIKQTVQKLEETFATMKEDVEKNASGSESETLEKINETIHQITDKLEI